MAPRPGYPGEVPIVGGGPLRQAGRLRIAGRRHEQHQVGCGPEQLFRQVWSQDEGRVEGGGVFPGASISPAIRGTLWLGRRLHSWLAPNAAHRSAPSSGHSLHRQPTALRDPWATVVAAEGDSVLSTDTAREPGPWRRS